MKMRMLKTYGFLVLGILGIFMLGAYSGAVIHGHVTVEPYRWAATGIITLWSLVDFIINNNKHSKS